MIHCVNLNATLDQVLLVDSLEPGAVLRAQASLSYPGGKGNNVARTVANLGGKVLLHAYCGAGERSATAAFFRGRGVSPRLTALPGEARPCVVILDAARNQETVVNSPSRLKGVAAGLQRLQDGLLKALRPGDLVTFSGSLPEGLRPDTFRRLIAAAQARGAVALLDSYGPGLKLGVEAAPFLVKPNAEELGATFGVPVAKREQVMRAARGLLRHGVRCAVVTLGARGALCATAREVLFAAPLASPRGLRSPLGCGDAFLGGLALALARGRDLAECLRWGTAAAWANLNAPGAAFFDPRQARGQVAHVKISRLAA